MKFEDIEIGKIYSCGDDAVNKIVDKGKDWICLLTYSYNHYVSVPKIYGKDDFIYEYWYEETESWIRDIFEEELRFAEEDKLTNRDE